MTDRIRKGPSNNLHDQAPWEYDAAPGVTDGYDPAPRQMPAGLGRSDNTGQVLLPLGHIANVGDFENPRPQPQ